MRYEIIKRPTPLSLSLRITDELAKGWRLVGGVSYDGEEYCQAICWEEPLFVIETKDLGESSGA